MSVTPFRWGILGAGGIAEQFTRDVLRLEDHRVVAVGSRTQVKADAFADKFAIGHRHDSYQKLVNDPDVDGVYVATHHPMHMRDTLLALNAGKPVLCEKPFAMSYDETKTMIDTARSKNLLLMEAMWARYLPHMIAIREVIKSGVLGEIISVRADHGQWFVKDQTFDYSHQNSVAVPYLILVVIQFLLLLWFLEHHLELLREAPRHLLAWMVRLQ